VPATNVYFGAAAGPTIYAMNVNNLGQFPFLPSFTTWDVTPAGESGVIVARAIDWTFNAQAGYNASITPIIDGVAQTPQYFNGSRIGEVKLEMPFTTPPRCARVAVQVQLLALTGNIQHRNIALVYVPLKQFPTG
jgi:hypothetical protein